MPKSRNLTNHNLYILENFYQKLFTINYGLNLLTSSEPQNELEELAIDNLTVDCLSDFEILITDFNRYFDCFRNELEFDF